MLIMGVATGINIIDAVRDMDMVGYLLTLGHEPVKVRNGDYWYLSPFRDEHTASFKVNRKLNRWYDHGEGKGGNLIDFGIAYHRCSVSDFLHMVDNGLSFHRPPAERKQARQKENMLRIISEKRITSFPLLRYLAQRCIPGDIAAVYCREVTYSVNGKEYYGIGFKNDSGGYELRNPYFKASSTPKDITTVGNGHASLAVFEGFMDFLSFKVLQGNTPDRHDYLVLNSTSFFERAKEKMERYDTVNLYLDRDETGQNCSRKALSSNGRYTDESHFYEGYKDLNEWLSGHGKDIKRRLKQKL